jgi:ABC-type cobalamin/Fe3+-siderophores transport system ATPase subunit
MLEIKNLSIELDHKRILEKISFSAKQGEILAIIGPNGAGKTTLLRAINGLLPIREGEISLDDKKLSSKSVTERARLIATVPQAFNLPPAFHVKDIVMLGRTPYLNWLGQTSQADEEIAHEAMRQTDSMELGERMIAELSAGEQQRVLLARALAQNTPVLLMDEPTTHLDLKYQMELLDLTKKLTRSKKLITLIVLHDLNLACRIADRVLVMDQGQIAAMGEPSKVMDKKLLSGVYQVPVRVEKKKQTIHIFPG